MGSLRHYSKSDIVGSLQSTAPDQVVPDCDPVVDAEMLDGAAIIQMQEKCTELCVCQGGCAQLKTH